MSQGDPSDLDGKVIPVTKKVDCYRHDDDSDESTDTIEPPSNIRENLTYEAAGRYLHQGR